MGKDDSLVFSTDGSHASVCPRCRESPCLCPEPQSVEPEKTPLHLSLENKGRGGKTVTLITGLPYNPQYANALLKRLKKKLGTGGAVKEVKGAAKPEKVQEQGVQAHTVLEFQGDRRTNLEQYLTGEGFPVRIK